MLTGKFSILETIEVPSVSWDKGKMVSQAPLSVLRWCSLV